MKSLKNSNVKFICKVKTTKPESPKTQRRIRRKQGFAHTHAYPHINHPALYRKLSSDNIRYITFTHHPEVELNNRKYITINLEANIDPNEKDCPSFIFPKVFERKRSALGAETRVYRVPNDKINFINNLFETLPIERVQYSKVKNKKRVPRRLHRSV